MTQEWQGCHTSWEAKAVKAEGSHLQRGDLAGASSLHMA